MCTLAWLGLWSWNWLKLICVRFCKARMKSRTRNRARIRPAMMMTIAIHVDTNHDKTKCFTYGTHHRMPEYRSSDTKRKKKSESKTMRQAPIDKLGTFISFQAVWLLTIIRARANWAEKCFVVIRVWAFWPSCHHGYHRFNMTFLVHNNTSSLCVHKMGSFVLAWYSHSAQQIPSPFCVFSELNSISFILRHIHAHTHTHIDSNRFVFELILFPLFTVTNFYDHSYCCRCCCYCLLTHLIPIHGNFFLYTYHWNQRKIIYRLDSSHSVPLLRPMACYY